MCSLGNRPALENENLSSESLAETISQWYENHKPVRDAILINKREIDKVKKSNSAFGETTLENQYRILKDELEKLEEKNKNQKSKRSQ